MKARPCRSDNVVRGQLPKRGHTGKPKIKTKDSGFDTFVARYYAAVYSFAFRLTDNPEEAILLTRYAFNTTRKQLRTYCGENVVASILMSNVIQAGLRAA